jgi:uncharacterized membrane protein
MSSATASDQANQALWQIRRGEKAHHHPVNQMMVDEASLGERLADTIAAGIGSWRFLIIQTVAVIAWVTLNLVGFINHWDPFPFILLNLLFSVQAAYTGPVLLLAGNRQAQKDRLTLEHTAQEADKTDSQTLEILTKIAENTELTVQILTHLEEQRAQLLRRLEERGVVVPDDSGDSQGPAPPSKPRKRS